VCVVLSLDCAEIDPPEDPLFSKMTQPPAGTPYPNLGDYLPLQYGLRNGLFRVMKVLDKYQLPVTVAIDAAVAQNYPFVVQQCKSRGWEFIGRGLLANYPLGNRLDANDAKTYIQRSLNAVEHSTGVRPRGWYGADYLETIETPDVLAELGVEYVLDWPNDEQPYPMKVSKGSLISLPTLLELDDVYAQEHRKLTVWQWEHAVQEAFDTLFEDSKDSGRLLTLSLHPNLMGQPFRVKSLDNVFQHILKGKGVWKATAGEIASWYKHNYLTSSS
jgi:hypothetical protein